MEHRHFTIQVRESKSQTKEKFQFANGKLPYEESITLDEQYQTGWSASIGMNYWSDNGHNIIPDDPRTALR